MLDTIASVTRPLEDAQEQLRQTVELLGVRAEGATAAVQGFGKVGRDTARFLAEAGALVVAVSDLDGAVFAPGGLDVPALIAHARLSGSVAGFAEAESIASDLILELNVDLLVPAAIEGVLTADNAPGIRARLIDEEANGPTTTAADAILADRDILVVPDILANAGGVAVSYFEWAQANQSVRWTERQVQDRLRPRMLQAWDAIVSFSERHRVPLRLAATALAVDRVAEAHRLRGLYP